MKIVIPVLMAVLALPACTDKKKLTPFDGHYFRTKVSKVDKNLFDFEVKIRDVSQSIEGARQAGEYAGISHCIRYYGSSDINWSVGPDTPAEELRVVDDTLIFRGVCPQ